MNVSLTPELEDFVNKKVKSGLYNSASEVIRAALRILKEQEALRKTKLERLRRDIMIGIEQLERGEAAPLDMEEIQEEARRQFSEKHRPR